MTAILDYCVPSRRRERQERKEQQALASRVNPRWGDTQITAPSEGGWNQPGYFGEQEKGLPGVAVVNGSPQNSGSSANTTPDLNTLYDKAIEAGITIEHKAELVQLPQPKEERKNISFTITLPWPSRRANSPPTSFNQATTSPPMRSEPAGTHSRPSTAHSSPPVTYIPASDKYMKDLTKMGKPPAIMNPLAQSPPDRAVETFPAGPYAAVPESYVKDMADLGLGPSPVQHDIVDPVLRHGPSPPLQHTSPIMRLEPIPATPYCVDNFSDDPRMERPEAVIPSHPAVAERHSRARSSSREPHSERYARMRSSSRGPTEDRSGAMRSSSSGPTEERSSSKGPSDDRIGSTRSSSRGPTPDHVGVPRSSSRDPGPDRRGTGRSSSRGPPADGFGTGRSSSKGPPADEFGTGRSSSRGPPADGFGTGRSSSRGPPADGFGTGRSSSRGPPVDGFGTGRSSSRGPPVDGFGTERSSSRGPPLDRTGRPRSTSMGPPAGRIAMVRSASREPTAERLAFSRASHRDSFSSNSSSATMFSDGVEDNKVVKHQIAPGKSVPNLNGVGQMAVAQNGNAQNGGPGGYYTSLASEYRQIAKDVETQALYDTDSSEGKEYRKMMKERLKETYNEPQELVPSASDLYG